MSQPFNHSIALNGAVRNPVNELLASVMRSFGEEPAPRREPAPSQETGSKTSTPASRRAPKSKI